MLMERQIDWLRAGIAQTQVLKAASVERALKREETVAWREPIGSQSVWMGFSMETRYHTHVAMPSPRSSPLAFSEISTLYFAW